MKKYKIPAFILLGIMLTAFTLGTAGIIHPAVSNLGTTDILSRDKLIGVFLTKNYLDLWDMEGYLLNHGHELLSGGEIGLADTQAYRNRLYAEKKALPGGEDGEISQYECSFPGVSGFCCFIPVTEDTHGSDHITQIDEGISARNLAMKTTDEGDELTMEASIYFSTQVGDCSIYINPVYQSKDGTIYTVAGNGAFLNGAHGPGEAFSTTLKEETSFTTGKEARKNTTSITVKLEFMNPPKEIILTQLDAQSQVLIRQVHSCDALPEEITPLPEAECILQETISPNGETLFHIYGKQDASIQAFTLREDNICTEKSISIQWEE